MVQEHFIQVGGLQELLFRIHLKYREVGQGDNGPENGHHGQGRDEFVYLKVMFQGDCQVAYEKNNDYNGFHKVGFYTSCLSAISNAVLLRFFLVGFCLNIFKIAFLITSEVSLNMASSSMDTRCSIK